MLAGTTDMRFVTQMKYLLKHVVIYVFYFCGGIKTYITIIVL